MNFAMSYMLRKVKMKTTFLKTKINSDCSIFDKYIYNCCNGFDLVYEYNE